MLRQQRRFRRVLGRILRRWADSLAPETESDAEAARKSLEDSECEEVQSSPAQSSRRIPGQPPQHWVELVRRAAPDLLRGGRDRIITYRAKSAPGGPPAVTRESALPATRDIRPGPPALPSLQQPETIDQPVKSAGLSPGPTHAAGSASADSALSGSHHPLSPLVQSSTKQSASRKRGENTFASGQAKRSEISGMQTAESAPISQQEITGPALSEGPGTIGSSTKRQEITPSLGAVTPEPDERKTPQHAVAAKPTVHSDGSIPSLHPVQGFPPWMQGAGAAMAGSGTRWHKRAFDGETFPGAATGGAIGDGPQCLAPAPLRRAAESPWPGLPEQSPTVAKTRKTDETVPAQSPAIEIAPMSWSVESSRISQDRWPELLDEPYSIDEAWSEALRNQDHLSMLDAEQRGDEGWSA